MFRFKKHKTSALASTAQDGDTGTVKKNKKNKFFDKGDNARTNKTTEEQKSTQSKTTNSSHENLNVDGKTTNQSDHLEPNINLSRDELLKLLSVFEGELQARDEVIAILKTECSQSTDTRYGLTSQPLKALQRDAATLEVTTNDHVCEQTKEQLKKIIQHQKESYKKLKQIHLATEDKYQRLCTESEEEKRKRQEYMIKSDDFVNLLEHDRDRLKKLMEQEKLTHDRKEKEILRKLKEHKDELTRMKTLSLELVEERQQQLQALSEQRQLTTGLQEQLQDLQSKVVKAEVEAATEKEHAMQLEYELEEHTNQFYKQTEESNAKLVAEVVARKQLEEKIKSMGRQIKKLKCVDKNLRKTDDHLERIQEKLQQEDTNEDLLEEVELLRKTVAAMQESEKIYTQAHEECREHRETLEKELTETIFLRSEVEKLKKSIRNRTDMERCIEEAMFRFDEINAMFEAECKKANKMKLEIEEYRVKLQKIDESEALLQLSETKLLQMHTAIHDLRVEKNDLEIKLQLDKDKYAQCQETLEDERTKVTSASQKTVEESKKVLKLKEELVMLETKRVNENESLHQRLKASEDQISEMITKEKAVQLETFANNLRKQVAMLKKRLDQLENETDMKGNEARLAKEEADKAKENLNISTEKLRRLVAIGLNEQIAIAERDHIKDKQTSLEITNTGLRNQVKTLESKLQNNALEPNKNNNNTSIKETMVNDMATQTANLEDTESNPAVDVRKLPFRHKSSTSPRVGATETKPSNIRRVSSSAKRDSSRDRPLANKVSLRRTSSAQKIAVTKNNTASPNRRLHNSCSDVSPAKENEEVFHFSSKKASPTCKPVSMTISHDPATEATPNFRIVRDTKTGVAQIETSVVDSKKGIHIRLSNKSSDSSVNSKPPSASLTSARSSAKPTASPKVTSRVAITPTNLHRRSESQTRKSSAADRRSSISPTRIPKLRNGTPAPSSGIYRKSSVNKTIH